MTILKREPLDSSGKERYMSTATSGQGTWASNWGTRIRGANQSFSRCVKPKIISVSCFLAHFGSSDTENSFCETGIMIEVQIAPHLPVFRIWSSSIKKMQLWHIKDIQSYIWWTLEEYLIFIKQIKYSYVMSHFMLFTLYSLLQVSASLEPSSKKHIRENTLVQSY